MTTDIIKKKEVSFFVRGREHTVKAEDVSPELSLNIYLRNILNLKGTKNMCFEGGCGACVVVVERVDPVTQLTGLMALNSCLVNVLACDGWKIYTVEDVGGALDGYHPIQDVLTKFNGTQCGYCTPGMVMNMYALYESGQLTMAEVENSFGGNLCRCTGYRPILSAFKSLCTDADPALLGHVDIEDIKVCQKLKCTKQCGSKCKKKQPIFLQLGDALWIKVLTLNDLLSTLATHATSKYMLVAGNTAKGVFPGYDPIDVYIDVNDVPELKLNEIRGTNLVIGANNSLTTTMQIFNVVSQENPGLAYLKKLAEHIDLVANVPVRNMASIAGNLMMKHANNGFQSDIFLILETIGAQITIVDTSGVEVAMSPKDFVTYDMSAKIIYYITLPSLGTNAKYESYKIMERAQNTHAMLNAGFLFTLRATTNIVDAASIVYGNVTPTFFHATATEEYLVGKNLFDDATLQGAFTVLANEITPNAVPPDPSPEFRRQLAISLFYKTVLSIAPSDLLSPRNLSGGAKLVRPISSGVQDYETNESLYPLTEPVPKLESLAQVSGVAEFIEDIPDRPGQLFAAFVLTEAAPGSTINTIDPSQALALEGIVAYYGKEDIPGENSFTPTQLFPAQEEIFCSGTVLFYNQPVGIIVGNDFGRVLGAVGLVQITYNPPAGPPLLTARQVISAGATDRIEKVETITPSRQGDDVTHVVRGTFDIYQQYHFHMETQCCNVIPTEDGLDVYPSTQWMDLIQTAISEMLTLPSHKINVNVRRCGGGFGGKISRNTLISCATALAAWKLRKPVRMALTLPNNMSILGKRFPLSVDYEVAVNDSGVIQYLNSTLYTDVGAVPSENAIYGIVPMMMTTYTSDTFSIVANTAVTDTPPNTWTRAPGHTEGVGAIEAIMEHIAYEIGVDPLDVRVANITTDTNTLPYIDDLKTWANIDERKAEIATFNSENRWKKRGMAITPMAYKFDIGGPFTATVSIYHADGTVAISHGGIEIGQGINTKAAQVCAYKLSIPLEKVTVIPSKNFISPNCTTTGGSVTSEAVCYGVIQACEQLIERMTPYNDSGLSWEELVLKCFQNFVNLSATGIFSPNEPQVTGYPIYGIVATEVELDVLTGQHIINRVDLIEDIGNSMSPAIDIGQVEGAFIMGIGYYLTERTVFNDNGKLLTNNTWTYTPPGVKDIPVDFRVKFPRNNPNPVGVLNSKAVAEPPLCLTICVPLAIRNAIASARVEDDDTTSKWYPFDGPTTVENVFTNSLNSYPQYVL